MGLANAFNNVRTARVDLEKFVGTFGVRHLLEGEGSITAPLSAFEGNAHRIDTILCPVDVDQRETVGLYDLRVIEAAL